MGLGDLWRAILDNIRALWPVRIIDADEQGVRFTLGKSVTLLTPGIHFFCPGLQKIETLNVKYQEIDCLLQTMETHDGHPTTFSANVGYDISDAVKNRTMVQDFDNTLERRARGLLAEQINTREYADVSRSLTDIEQAVLIALRKRFRPCGVRIRNVSITDFAKAKPYRFFGGLQ